MNKWDFDIPNGWKSLSLMEVLASLSSGSRPKGGSKEKNIGILSLGGEHVTDDGLFELSKPQYVPYEFFEDIKAEAKIAVGDILINKDGAKTGKLALVTEEFPIFPACINEHLFRLRTNSEIINSRYLFAFLLSALGQRQIKEEIQGSAQGGINRRFAKYLKILFPEDERERNAITEVIRMADNALSVTRKELRATHRLKTALMQQLFTKGIPGRHKKIKKTKWVEGPESWEYKKLSDISEISSGFTMGRDLSRYETMRVPYVTVGNVKEGTLDLSNVGQIEVKVSELESLKLKRGDILTTEGGDRDKLGRGCVWKGEIGNCVYQNHIFRIRMEPDTYKPELFHFLLQTHRAKKYFFSHAKQTSNLCTVNSRELKRFPLLIPDMDEQEDMLDILSSMEGVILSITKQCNALSCLKKSLLQNLLTGKVRVNMEAAHELLRGKDG